MANKKATRITKIREVRIVGRNIYLESIGFNGREAFLKNGFTRLVVNGYNPDRYPTVEENECLRQPNFFIGEVEVGCYPKLADESAPGKKYPRDCDLVKEGKVENYVIYLPEEHDYFKLFDKARYMKEEICQYLQGDHDELWEVLEKSGVVRNGVLLNPQYLFIVSARDVKEKCYELEEQFKVTWITPNACLSETKEAFFELMKECYGKMDVVD